MVTDHRERAQWIPRPGYLESVIDSGGRKRSVVGKSSTLTVRCYILSFPEEQILINTKICFLRQEKGAGNREEK